MQRVHGYSSRHDAPYIRGMPMHYCRKRFRAWRYEHANKGLEARAAVNCGLQLDDRVVAQLLCKTSMATEPLDEQASMACIYHEGSEVPIVKANDRYCIMQ